ncbi:MAG: 2-dehydropantoate 2-reductase, partial [Homoserinimonas sp.]|nr:2-dehydropantoate 2-reductase [Homoserinimonas sp.]
MGGTMAALLDRAGHEVEVTARGQNLAAIQRDGLRLTGAWGEHTARVAAGEQLTVRPELAILATKAMDAAPAGAANARLLRGVPLIVVQNGLGGLETVERALPESTTIGALSLIAASYVAFGHVDVTTAAATWLGIPGSGDDTAAQIAASVLSEAFPCSAVANFDGARWTKLVINQVNALPAITGLSVQDVIAHPGLRRIMTRSMRETVRAGLHAGVR